MAAVANHNYPPNPADHSTGSASAPTAASSYAVAQADACAAPNFFIKEELSSQLSADAAPAASRTASLDISPGYALDMPVPNLGQHHEIYFRLRAVAPHDKGPYRFANSSRLCAAMLAQLASIPSLSDTELFATGKLTLTISKHHNPAAKIFIYTASFATTSIPNGAFESTATITDLILVAQNKNETDRKAHGPKGFCFNLPIIVPGAGHLETSTRCSFSYDRTSLLGLTTIDFQVKVPSSISISPQEDFALLIVQLFTPRAGLSDADYLTLTRTDRARFANCCTPRKSVTTPHGDWMDELMFGTFALNFEDSDSRDPLIWNFLMFGAVFGLDPRFGHHQQFQLFIPTLHDQHQLDRRPTAMRDAVKSFKADQRLANLLPAKPRRSRPKSSDATSSDTESESLFLENIARRSEAILILREVPPNDALATLHYPPLDNAQFTHVLMIPQAPAVELQDTLSASNSAPAPAKNLNVPLCMSWDTPATCQAGKLCHFAHAASATATKTSSEKDPVKPLCMSWETSLKCKAGNLCRFTHSEASQSEEFQGEGKKDIACIKFSEFRCSRGNRCLYRHDLRDELAHPSTATRKFQITLPSRGTIQPAPCLVTSTVARRLQPASPGRGAVQLASFLDALDRTFVSSLLEPIHLPQITALVSLAACAADAPTPQLAIQLASPLLSSLKRMSTEHQPAMPLGTPLTNIEAPRFTRSLLTVNVGELNGFCSRGHKIFRRTPIRASETHKCSFCKTEQRSDVFTCSYGCSHSCRPCLYQHNTAQAPPRCMAQLCSGSCTIESLGKHDTCWNGGHSLKKGVGVWLCNICKFRICRTCAASAPPTQPELIVLPKPLGPPETHVSSSSSSACSANASAPMAQ
jgi:hypothetical protein